MAWRLLCASGHLSDSMLNFIAPLVLLRQLSQEPSVNWNRDIIQFKVLASLSGGGMGKEEGAGVSLFTVEASCTDQLW